MKRLFVMMSLVSAFFVTASPSHAALTYEITFGQERFVVAPGESTTMDVFFREISTDGSTAKLAAGGADGLFATGFVFDFGGGSAALRFDGYALNDSPEGFDPAFSTQFDDLANSRIQFNSQSRDIDDGIEVSSFSDSRGEVYEILIGTLTMTNLGDQASQTILTLSRSSLPFENLFVDFTEPGAVSYGTATVTAVPEPSAAIALASFALSAHVLRSRRKTKATVC